MSSVAEKPSTDAILAAMKPSEKVAKLASPGMNPMELFSLLVKNELYGDGLGFMARFLPKRHAIWWGCLCIEHVGEGKLPKPEEAALGATVQWVLDPSEENRQKAREAGIAAKKSTAAGCLAMAAFWSGGSISLQGQPEVPPEPDQCEKAVTGAMKIAATSKPKVKAAVNQKHFLALALEVAEGKNLWTEAKSKAPGV